MRLAGSLAGQKYSAQPAPDSAAAAAAAVAAAAA